MMVIGFINKEKYFENCFIKFLMVLDLGCLNFFAAVGYIWSIKVGPRKLKKLRLSFEFFLTNI